MATGASNGQTNFMLTALDGKQDLPPGDHPLWIFDEGHAVRWLRTTEDRSALVEAGCQMWSAVTEAAKREERTEWLSERLHAASTEAVTWMSDGAATLVPEPLRNKAGDADWLEAETGLRHLGTDAETVVGSPYVVVVAPDHGMRQAISAVSPRVVFRHPRLFSPKDSSARSGGATGGLWPSIWGLGASTWCSWNPTRSWRPFTTKRAPRRTRSIAPSICCTPWASTTRWPCN